MTALGLLVAYFSYGLALALTYSFITSREEPDSLGRPMGRRMFLAGAGGVVLALSSDWLTRRLVDSSTVSYGGTSYLGTDLEFITHSRRPSRTTRKR